MKQATLARHLISGAVVTSLIFASLFLARQTTSTVVASAIGLAFAALAVAVEGAVSLLGRRELDVARSLGRVREYRQSVSIYDNDSGLYADWYLGLRLHEEVARSHRYGQPFALLLIEDSEGHLGEAVKRMVFKALTDAVRTTDIVAHLTDKRFAVLLTNTDRSGATVAADRVRERLPLRTIELGVASYPDDGQDAVSLLTAAGASPEVITAITRGSKGTKTSIMQSDWVRPTDSSAPGDTEIQRPSPARPALVQGTSSAVLDDPATDLPSNVIPFQRATRTCGVTGCGRLHHARGLCARHYAAQKRGRVA